MELYNKIVIDITYYGISNILLIFANIVASANILFIGRLYFKKEISKLPTYSLVLHGILLGLAVSGSGRHRGGFNDYHALSYRENADIPILFQANTNQMYQTIILLLFVLHIGFLYCIQGK